MSDDSSSKLLITFIIFLVLFNYPLITLADQRRLFLGFPLLYFYMFVVWGAIIVVVARVVRQKK